MMPSHLTIHPVAFLLVAILLTLLALTGCETELAQPTPTPTPTMAPTPTPEYLRQDILPCEPIAGSDLDPCEADVHGVTATNAHFRPAIGEPITVRGFLGDGLFGVHLVVRGTYVPDSLRCMNQTRHRSSTMFDIDDYNVGSGLGDVHCYVDMRVGSYILGTGPASLTLLVEREIVYDYDADNAHVERTINNFETILTEGGVNFRLDVPEGGILGREVIAFLTPLPNTAVENWFVVWTLDVQRQEEDGVTTVVAVHPQRDSFRDDNPTGYQTYRDTHLEMTLPTLTRAVTEANQQRLAEFGGRIGAKEGITYPMVVSDANDLQRFISDVGGYDDPDDLPLQPPPVYAPPPATLTATATARKRLTSLGQPSPGLLATKSSTGFAATSPGRSWAVLASVTGAGHSTAALWCDRVHEFRVGAHGDGTTYNARAGRWSPVATATTSTCTAQAPKFFNEPFAYDVSIGAVAGDPVGTPDAIDLNGDTITYSITAGNAASKFAIDAATGCGPRWAQPIR